MSNLQLGTRLTVVACECFNTLSGCVCVCVCLEILVSPADPMSVLRQQRATCYTTQDSPSSFMGINFKAPRIAVKWRVSDTGDQTEKVLAASDGSVMANERGNDIHSRLCIFSMMCHHAKGIADVS